MPRKKPGKKKVALPILHPDAAGIDIGATEIYVAVPPDRDPESIRTFATFTQDLNHLADWLQQCGVGRLLWNPLESIGFH
jgi:transposase